jgi:hypothetical protein
MALRNDGPDSWLDEKLLPLHKWDPIVIHPPTPLPLSSKLALSSSSKNGDQQDTLHGYKSLMRALLTNILSSNGEWHAPLLMIIIDYIITCTLPFIGQHIMSLEHPSARGERSDRYDPDIVTSHNGYYYVGCYNCRIIVSCFIDPSPLSLPIHPHICIGI